MPNTDLRPTLILRELELHAAEGSQAAAVASAEALAAAEDRDNPAWSVPRLRRAIAAARALLRIGEAELARQWLDPVEPLVRERLAGAWHQGEYLRLKAELAAIDGDLARAQVLRAQAGEIFRDTLGARHRLSLEVAEAR